MITFVEVIEMISAILGFAILIVWLIIAISHVLERR